MTDSPKLPLFNRIERYVVRPVFVFVTFALVLFAITQASGRFTMQSLSVFEDELNALLATVQIELRGLQGGWRGFNPVVELDALTFPAGSAKAVVLELDVLESIFRNTLIVHRLHVGSAQIHVEKTNKGWRLRGMGDAQTSFDVWPALRHSDELRGDIQFIFHSEAAGTVLADGLTETEVADAQVGQLNTRIWLANRNNRHFGELHVTNPTQIDSTANPQQGGLQLQMWRVDPVWFSGDALNAAVGRGSLQLPRLLTGMALANVSIERLFWHDNQVSGGGEAEVSLGGVEMPNAAVLSAHMEMTAARDKDQWRGVVRNLELTAANQSLLLAPVYAFGDASQHFFADPPSQIEMAADLLQDKEELPVLQMWSETLDLDALSTFLGKHLEPQTAPGRWVKGLGIRGQANNLQAFYDPELGFGYLISLNDLSLNGYRGVPSARNLQARIWGYGAGIALQASGQNSYLKFDKLYDQGWTFDSVQGVIKGWFAGDYLGLRGSHLRGALGESRVGGSFAITRPQQRYEQRLSLKLGVDQVSLDRAKSFVPSKIPQALADWLEQGPRGGQMHDANFVYHGQVHQRPGELGRRIELLTKVTDARVEYAPLWPEVAEVTGTVHVAGVDTRINVVSGRTQEVRINNANIVLHDNTRYAAGQIDTQADAGALLDFVRGSPLQENLSFVSPGWQGAGLVRMRGDLVIPIQSETAPSLQVDLDFDVENMTLAMPDYRLVTRELTGQGQFELPHHLTGQFEGKIFGRPASVRAHYNDNWLKFDITGVAAPADVYALLDTQDQVPIAGEFEFDSQLSIAMQEGVTNLFVETDLRGLAVDLPGEFSKAVEDEAKTDLNVQFLADYSSVSWRYKNATGWVHYGDGIERGALGVGEPPPMTAQDQRAIVIAGRMPKVVLSDWVSGQGDSAVALPLDWTITDLRVDQFVIDEMIIDDLSLSGSQQADVVSFKLDAPTVRGVVTIPSKGPLELNLDYLEIAVDADSVATQLDIGAPKEDPISPEVGRNLPAAQVNIAQLNLGDEPFGAWRFVIEPQGDAVAFSDFAADVNGVHIKDSRVLWDLEQNNTSFVGSLTLDDMSETLPKWDYAPSLSTKTANVSANIGWAGSPVNVNMLGAYGELSFQARDGRFIEVESGNSGLRILSLLNFTKVAKRISFDFSDVVGDGLSFEKINAQVNLNRGDLRFPQPMIVESSSGNFQVGGHVDLRSGTLDNEMIVTLPVSKSLPWYGVYLALANPLAGLGVVVGERVLRKPIEQFSTAKFEVTGTLNDPKVKFVSLWDQSMKDPELAGQPAVPEEKPITEDEQVK